MPERKLSPFHQKIQDNLDNRKTRQEFKDWSSRTGILTSVLAIAGNRHPSVVDAVLKRSEGKPLPHTGKDTLYYPPEILTEILKEVLKERMSPRDRQNIEIHLSKFVP